MAPGIVEALEMVDVDDGEGQGLVGVAVAMAVQRFVERLAVGQVGQGVGHRFHAHLIQVLAQAIDFTRRVRQARFQQRMMGQHHGGGFSQGPDQAFQGAGFDGGHRIPRAFQRQRIGLLRLLGFGDDFGNRSQFARQLQAGVADLVIQLHARNELAGQAFRDILGNLFAGIDQAVDFLGQRAFGVTGDVEPELIVHRRRPYAVFLHQAQGLARECVGAWASDADFDVVAHYRFRPSLNSR